jgi:hypothetical protein
MDQGVNLFGLSRDGLIFPWRERKEFSPVCPGHSWAATKVKVLATERKVLVVYAPIAWKLAGLIRDYCFIQFVLTDAIRAGFHRLLDHRDILFKR